MGIRYEKDTILNWINEMGKFLRLIVDKYEAFEPLDQHVLDKDGYKHFFGKSREDFHALSDKELNLFLSTLEPEQIRPLAQLYMYDGLQSQSKTLLTRAKFLFNFHMQQSGSFAFEDFALLDKIDKALVSL